MFIYDFILFSITVLLLMFSIFLFNDSHILGQLGCFHFSLLYHLYFPLIFFIPLLHATCFFSLIPFLLRGRTFIIFYIIFYAFVILLSLEQFCHPYEEKP